ncbi:uncharacterized protein isoform X3 [Danio rerio]|uniref:Uncharacterized protein isoform X3 n=1 Tax=Danio rerio TaxID=7955 RepID=A0AC58G9V3_DANRE
MTRDNQVTEMGDGQIPHIQYEHDGTFLQEQQIELLCLRMDRFSMSPSPLNSRLWPLKIWKQSLIQRSLLLQMQQ